MAIRLAPPLTEEDWREARRLIEEYAGSPGADLCFQNIGHELDHLAEDRHNPVPRTTCLELELA